MDFWTLYALSRLDGIKGIFTGCLAFWVIFVVICGIVLFATWCDGSRRQQGAVEENVKNKWFKMLCWAIIPTIFFIILTILTPTFKQALVFAGVDYISNNERVAENVDKTLQVFESIVDKKLKALEEVTE